MKSGTNPLSSFGSLIFLASENLFQDLADLLEFDGVTYVVDNSFRFYKIRNTFGPEDLIETVLGLRGWIMRAIEINYLSRHLKNN